ncbi:MAG TPA: xanthine dehydrogenase family protein molybdopterin-binding subunit [Stellaceae bacterium]|nr:xanthine dehydrogenase family protein molybdopterin-binding subunit [Stellaceae bacterium]
MTEHAPLTRRLFLVSSAVAGGGLMLGVGISDLASAAGDSEGSTPGAKVNNWVIIQSDNTIIVRIARSEMGQGSFTALPMLVCEELECDWSKVKGEYASATENLDNSFGSMSTGGSRAIRESQEMLRKAGASGREMLLAAAAQKWGVPRSELTAKNSIITHVPTGRTMTYGEIAEAASKLAPPSEVKLKDPSEWTLVGKAQTRFDIADKVMGRPVYGIDVRIPGMLYATIAQCPVFGGKLKSYDEAKIKTMPGVRHVVPMGDAVAVVGDSYWQVRQALAALPIAWDEGPNAALDDAAIAEMLRQGLTANDALVAANEGDTKAALAKSTKVIEAEYHVPFLAHATMEPMNCTAHVMPDKVEVWAPSQNAQAALAVAAKAAGVDPKNVEVHITMLGGGFGRRGAFQDFVRQAVTIAKAVDKPVKLLWSREEDMRHDFYRPVSMAKLAAGLDASGHPIAWQIRIAGQSIVAAVRPQQMKNGLDQSFLEGLAEMPYEVENRFVDYAMRNTPIPVGFWRSVNNSQNAFYKECFLDELAAASGQDPYQLRRKLLQHHPKNLAVLDAAAKQAGWETAAPAGVFRGIAYHDSYGSLACGIVELSVSDKNEIKVHRIVCALDPGYVVNPDTVVTQVEGAIVYGLTAALYDKITIKNGRVEQSNFDDYPMLRLRTMPKIEVVQVPSGGFWGGVGEVGLPPVAPAMCNALFAATGKRIRSLPLKDHGFTAA